MHELAVVPHDEVVHAIAVPVRKQRIDRVLVQERED